MNTANLYLGEIRRGESSGKTSHIGYTILKKLENGNYRDMLSPLRKSYKPTYNNIGDLYINTDPDYLIPYYEAIPETQMKLNKSRKEIKQELEQLRKEMEIDTAEVFIGYIAQATSINYIPGYGDSSLARFLTGIKETEYKKIKKSIFLKQGYDTYIDLKSGTKYKANAFKKGEIVVPAKLFETIFPFNDCLPEEEKCIGMPKRKILRKFEEMNKGSSKK